MAAWWYYYLQMACLLGIMYYIVGCFSTCFHDSRPNTDTVICEFFPRVKHFNTVAIFVVINPDATIYCDLRIYCLLWYHFHSPASTKWVEYVLGTMLICTHWYSDYPISISITATVLLIIVLFQYTKMCLLGLGLFIRFIWCIDMFILRVLQ